MDVHNKEIRSYNMSRIKGKKTKPEEVVAKYLFANGFRYRRNVKGRPGTPDIVLKKYRTVIFVNGCFWHCHEGCKWFVLPETNAEFWKKKFDCNRERDKQNYKKLQDDGWNVIIVWECEIRHSDRKMRLETLVEEITRQTCR